MKNTLLGMALLALSSTAFGVPITYVFSTNTATGAGSISYPAGAYPGAGNNDGNAGFISLGTAILNLQLSGNDVASLTGSSTLTCVAEASGGSDDCASTATAEAPGAGHAAGLGISDQRINNPETITLTLLNGYTADLIAFQLTALTSDTSEQAAYAINGGGAVTVTATGNNPIDTFNVNQTFTTLVFSVPTGNQNPETNTFALYSITLDIFEPPTNQEVPEPTTFALMGGSLVALGVFARRRRK